MSQYLILAIVMIILICLIYWIFFKDTDENNRAQAENFISKSAGVFDKSARKAYELIEHINQPLPIDHYHHGNITYHNILEGNLHNNRGAAVGVLNNYTNAIIGMRRRRDPINRMMIDDVENIYTEQQRLMRNDHINYDILDMITTEDIALQLALMTLGDTINENAPIIRTDTINDRIERAKEDSATRVEAVNKAFDEATVYSNNPQNVHDSKVNSDLRAVLDKLKSTAPINICPNECIREITDYINASEDDFISRNREQALRGVNKAAEAIYISTFADTEQNILAYTWERCKHKRNSANELLMKDAVVTALIDGIENSTQVCINGRCARILNSLATLDYDYDISTGALTLEAYRNQIFQETKLIINREIDNAMNNDMKDVVEAYNNGDISSDKEMERIFLNKMKSEIDLNLSSYEQKISNDDMKKIKYECYAYALID